MDAFQVAAAMMGGGALTAGGHVAVQWLRSRGERHGTDTSATVKLQEHWTDTTLALVNELKEELREARGELHQLRSMTARLAHLEEALDHIHALLAALRSDDAAEIKAAERRAQAFLRRMRGDRARSEAAA